MATIATVPSKERERLVEQARTQSVMLNGSPAILCGAKNEYATVRSLETGVTADFPWPAVSRVLARGGEFRS